MYGLGLMVAADVRVTKNRYMLVQVVYGMYTIQVYQKEISLITNAVVAEVAPNRSVDEKRAIT